MRLQPGLCYGPLPRQRLDLYLPEHDKSGAPALLFLHGGAWVSGSRSDYGFVGVTLARLGAVVAIADYRLWPDVAHPAFIEDSALAAQWVAARHGPAFVMGHSAGAFLAACIALDPRWDAREQVRGFIGISGPYDFGAHEVTPPAIFAGLDRIQAAPGPLQGAPPMLLLHGGRDTTVGPYHSEILAERARRAGVPVRHVVWPQLSHIDIMAGFTPAARWLRMGEPAVVDEIAAFVRKLAPHPPAG